MRLSTSGNTAKYASKRCATHKHGVTAGITMPVQIVATSAAAVDPIAILRVNVPVLSSASLGSSRQ